MQQGDTLKRIEAFKRQCLDELIGALTPPQKARLDQCYPQGFDNLDDSQFRNAVRLCENTITKANKAKVDI